MPVAPWIVWTLAAAVALYVAAVVALVAAGRRGDARALAGFVPDCIVLLRRLLASSQLGRRDKALVWALVGYLAMPLDLVPDVIPVAGQLDDAILVALVLRRVLRSAGAPQVAAHWPGPASSLALVQRLAGAARTG